MTELQLYKFIHENKIEYHNEQDGIYCFVNFYLLEKFANIIGHTYLTDQEQEIILKDEYFAIVINDICDYFDIDPKNIFMEGL